MGLPQKWAGREEGTQTQGQPSGARTSPTPEPDCLGSSLGGTTTC